MVKRWIKLYAIIVATIVIIVFSSYLLNSNEISTARMSFTMSERNDKKYLISTPKCRIPDLSPFNSDMMQFFHPENYTPCSNYELLTYAKTINGSLRKLYVNQDAVKYYTKREISCCYSRVRRATKYYVRDNEVRFSNYCTTFQTSVTVKSNIAYVRCFEKDTLKDIYENMHTFLAFSNATWAKSELPPNKLKKPLSVLFIGIDSISRLSLMRLMPRTHKYLEHNGWINLKGYNKVGENTFPNLMAILTGMNNTYARNVCDPTDIGRLDKCDIIWYKYNKYGFITGYAEDETNISTFNYLKKGFINPPTDFYFRPYMIAAEGLKVKKIEGMTYCSGPETSGERILNLAKDFAVNLKELPSFGFFWTNSFSHESINLASAMDSKFREFFEYLEANSVLENTIIVFLSDHGFRFDKPRRTYAGWLEDRLPFIYLWFPRWFQKSFSKEYHNVLVNSERLTTPYDLYMTLQHILVISGHNYQIRASSACPKCKSLFLEAEINRSCEDAGIEPLWCSCVGYDFIDLKDANVVSASKYVLDQINSQLDTYENAEQQCERFVLRKMITAGLSPVEAKSGAFYLLLMFETVPFAVFEVVVEVNNYRENPQFRVNGEVNRLDIYKEHSGCVANSKLEKYCYCKSIATYLKVKYCTLFNCL